MARTAKNPWLGINYLDTQPGIATPPAYWLQRLFDYDAELVVFPSIMHPYQFVLARRQRMTMGMRSQALESTLTQLDTKFCLQNGLVPVCMIYRVGTTWSIDNIISSLQARDIWANGGGEMMADKLDKQDERERKATENQTRDDLWMRSGQAWESYKRRTGQRVSVPGSGSERQPPTTSSSGSTAGSGLVITG